MSTIATLAPDKALVSLIEGKISVNLSSTESRIVPVYRQGGRPNTVEDEEFIDVLHNGVIKAITRPLGAYKGNLAVAIYCKAFDDGTAKFNRIESIMVQLEALVSFRYGSEIYFEVDNNNLITPLTYDAESGYSIVILNIEWHTTQ